MGPKLIALVRRRVRYGFRYALNAIADLPSARVATPIKTAAIPAIVPTAIISGRQRGPVGRATRRPSGGRTAARRTTAVRVPVAMSSANTDVASPVEALRTRGSCAKRRRCRQRKQRCGEKEAGQPDARIEVQDSPPVEPFKEEGRVEAAASGMKNAAIVRQSKISAARSDTKSGTAARMAYELVSRSQSLGEVSCHSASVRDRAPRG